MVKILANGEVVEDDDPRARNIGQSQRAVPQRGGMLGGMNSQTRMGGAGLPPQQNQGQIPSNFLRTINQTLVSNGIPACRVGSQEIQPIVYIGMILSLIFFGLPGLIFCALLYFVSQWSSNGPPSFLSAIFGRPQSDSDNTRGQGTGRGRGMRGGPSGMRGGMRGGPQGLQRGGPPMRGAPGQMRGGPPGAGRGGTNIDDKFEQS